MFTAVALASTIALLNRTLYSDENVPHLLSKMVSITLSHMIT